MLRSADDGEPAWECLRCEASVLSADRMEGNAAEGSHSDDLDLNSVSLESEDFLSTTSE